MSWGDENWHIAAHDYHAGRKRDRRQGNRTYLKIA